MSSIECLQNEHPDIMRKFVATVAKAVNRTIADQREASEMDEEYMTGFQYYQGLFVS